MIERIPMRPRRQGGFTLIELMITVAIIAILAAVAYPAYTNAVLKGRRAEGRTALTALLQQQERFFSANNTYRGFNGSTDASNTGPALKAFSGDSLASSAYTLGAAACPGGTTPLSACVLVFAVPKRSDPLCGMLTITSVGIVRGFGPSLTASGSGSSTAVSASPTTSPDPGCWN